MLKAMRHEYAVKRKLVLRIVPNIIENQNRDTAATFVSAGFSRCKSTKPMHTFVLDLSFSLEESRKNFRSNWRNHLNRAEKNGLEVIEGTDDKLYKMFKLIYDEMLARKRYQVTEDIDAFGSIQMNLPEPLKMKIMICKHQGKPVSGLVCSAIGNTAIYLLGATSNEGMKLQASYLLQWKTLEWLKKISCPWYDLWGINPERNPGVYHFKAGLGGKDVRYLGQFDACESLLGFLLAKIGDLLRTIW